MADPESRSIEIWHRARGRVEAERVYGDFWVRLLYGSGVGRFLAHHVLAGRVLSTVTGSLLSTRRSASRIHPFAESFGIPLDEFEDREWGSFNDFFTRRFRPGVRSFCSDPDEMPAFAEARYLAFERVDPELRFPVKGRFLSPAAVIGEGAADGFGGGPLLLARLAPVDYHRFHFPDDGEVIGQWRIGGRLHSVNPLALRQRPEILATNERQVTIMRTAHFGRLAMVEVGAMNVGRIVQTYRGTRFGRGDEKGYFCFGASTVLLFGEAGRWRPAADLLEQTAHDRETLVRLGDEVARTLPAGLPLSPGKGGR